MVENEYSKVKVNNEMDYCSVTDMDSWRQQRRS